MDYPPDFETFFFSSTGLSKNQVSKHMLEQVHKLESTGNLDYLEFFDAIIANERPHGRSRTKPAEEFRGLLKGFWKAHYYHPNFMMQNIVNDLGVANQKPSKHFDKAIFTTLGNNKLTAEQKASKLAEELVINPIRRRMNKNNLTGEWIIFKKFNHKNYYLCLGFHHQTDEEILKLLAEIINKEFSFLANP